jgi:hypothetical protein
MAATRSLGRACLSMPSWTSKPAQFGKLHFKGSPFFLLSHGDGARSPVPTDAATMRL